MYSSAKKITVKHLISIYERHQGMTSYQLLKAPEQIPLNRSAYNTAS